MTTERRRAPLVSCSVRVRALWSPLMYEGVEAGEDEQRHHGAQRHHVVEPRLQHAARVLGHRGGVVQRLVVGARGGVL